MDTREIGPLNAIVSEHLRALKKSVHPRVGNEQIAEQTGINIRTVKRILTNQSKITFNDFFALSQVLGVAPAVALEGVVNAIREKEGGSSGLTSADV